MSLDRKIYVAVGSGNRGGGPELSSTEVFFVRTMESDQRR